MSTDEEWRSFAKRQLIISEIGDIRFAQDEQWGAAHDDKLTAWDWFRLFLKWVNRLGDGGRDWRSDLLVVAALCIAAVESYDRKHKQVPRKKRRKKR